MSYICAASEFGEWCEERRERRELLVHCVEVCVWGVGGIGNLGAEYHTQAREGSSSNVRIYIKGLEVHSPARFFSLGMEEGVCHVVIHSRYIYIRMVIHTSVALFTFCQENSGSTIGQ